MQRLRLWTPARYAAAAPAWCDSAWCDPGRPDAVPATRGDLVHHLAQWCADRAADLDGRPSRPVPRLDSDLGLADQLAVTSDDLVRCAPPVELAVAATAHLLSHRVDLLEDDVPPGLAAALGLPDVVAAGRAICGG